MSRIRLRAVDDEWEAIDVEQALGEERVSDYTIERFFAFLEAHPGPDSFVYYGDRTPAASGRIDSANLVAKLLRFIDEIDANGGTDEWGSGLLAEEIRNLSAAAVKLIQAYDAEYESSILETTNA